MELQLVGIGLDIVDIHAIARVRFKERLAEYFLLPTERSGIQGPRGVQYLASRFAVKEAVIKAFPGFLSPFEFRIEKEGPKPVVVFSSPEYARQYVALVSITHGPAVAAAVAAVYRR